ncbi:MAG: hypothetical protein GEU81_16445 [Nitriliruptorales bacterium]|nr:hypothetical protein [Nitriliruptorales bacterium]
MLTALQQRLAAVVAGLPEARGFALAGGSGLAAHGMLDRPTQDLDYFGSPHDREAVHHLAAAIERACAADGLDVRRERETEAFVRLSVTDGQQACEVDIAIDYRALDPVPTRHGPALDLRELGANKVLAIFDRAAPRDFLDLAELTKRFPLPQLITLAVQKDPGLDLDVLDHAMDQLQRIPPDRLGLDERGYRTLQTTVHRWQTHIRQLRDHDIGLHPDPPNRGPDLDNSL